jgi:hypothetical protein
MATPLDGDLEDRGTRDSFLIEFLSIVGHGCAHAISSASLAAAGSGVGTTTRLGDAIAALSAHAETLRLLRPPITGGLVDFTETVTGICRAIGKSSDIEDRGITLLLVFDESILLDAERSWRASVVISELVSEGCRREFLPRFGFIRVRLAASSDQIVCSVDTDGRLDSPDETHCYTALPDMLAGEIGGRIKRKADRYGSSVELSFPVGLKEGERSSRSSGAASEKFL